MIEPYLNRSLLDLEGEEWVDFYKYEDSFAVSNFGRVKGKRRLCKGGNYWLKEIIYKQSVFQGKCISANPQGCSSVPIVVVTSFLRKDRIDAVPKGYVIHHKDFDVSNNRLSNLEIIPVREMMIRLHKEGRIDTLASISAMHQIISDKTRSLSVYNSSNILVAKICERCMSEKPIKEYYHGKSNLRFCKSCRLIAMGVKDVGKHQRISELKIAGLRKCTRCSEIKPLKNFSGNATNCKPCFNQHYKYQK